MQPWVHQAPWEKWQHGQAARRALQVIPADATVAANTPLVPLLAQREVVVRFPYAEAYRDRAGKDQPVDWIAVDLDWLRRYGVAFPGDAQQFRKASKRLRQLLEEGSYGVRAWRTAWWCCSGGPPPRRRSGGR